MSFAKKFAAFGAAAAISATGLVAASGVAANAADVTKSVAYNCDIPGFGTKAVSAEYSIPALPASIPAGTKVPGKAITAKVTLPADVANIIVVGFGGAISGTLNGNVAFGSQSVASSITIPEGTKITDGTKDATLNASGTLAGFTPSAVGMQAVKLPAAVSGVLGGLSINCTATSTDLALPSVNVTKSSTGGTTGASPALKAAQAKLAKDTKSLAAAKKALKKAKGHKKVVLKKKVAKLTKTVKADKTKVASLSK